MGKYIKVFKNHSAYESFINGGGVAKPNVSTCTVENEVHYKPLKPELFDYVYSDGTYSSDIQEGKTCVGIVVIPQGHIDDKCRIMSINNMQELVFTDDGSGNYTVSENTGVKYDTTMKWYKDNSHEQTSFQSSKVVNIYPDNTIKGLGEGDANYFPKYDGTVQYVVEGYNDGNPYMWNYDNASATGGTVPSPFMNVTDGSSLSDTAPNPMYAYSNGDATANSLQTIASGATFTDQIINFSSGGVTSQVSGVTVAQDCPAASACRAYNPMGTGFHFGEWYLPTLAELGYVYFNLTTINTRLSMAGLYILSSNRFWSSSEYSRRYVWIFDFSDGIAFDGHNTKNMGDGCVRSFLAF